MLPDYAREHFAAQSAQQSTLYDLVCEVAKAFGCVPNDVLRGMSPRQFWQTLGWIRARREEIAEASGKNPMAFLGLFL